MPGLKDFLPQSPWNGPPLPAFLFKGVGYVRPPMEIEADLSRGVIYVHDLGTGKTVLRICRVPPEVMDSIPKYGAELDLATATPYLGRRRGKIYRKSPIFLSWDGDSIIVETEAGEIILKVLGVPRASLALLDKAEFLDITVGFTK